LDTIEVVLSPKVLRFRGCWMYKCVWALSSIELAFGMRFKPI